MIFEDFREAGFRIFGLYGFHQGQCECGNPACKAAGKHPIASNWQHTPDWSDEQFETAIQMGQFATGYGVLCKGLLVIDVDARNGGIESYAQLIKDVPEVASAGLIVETGSGGGSKHLYFALDVAEALVQHHNKYKGIDFKSSGFVVGPGSCHKSGAKYNVLIGSPYDIEPAPVELLNILKKPDYHRAEFNGDFIDYTNEDIADMLKHVPPDLHYDDYILVGMSIHDATGGTGFEIWDKWAQRSEKYTGAGIFNRWKSFGKCENPVTIGTLVHMAQKNGWRQSVTFKSDINFDFDMPLKLDTNGIDLARPPGFVGDLAAWINSQSVYPRENLAVAAAIMVASSVGGMRYIDALDNITPNVFVFGVAGSGTGKEAILKAATSLMKSAGVHGAIYGDIKSQQEIYRNLTRHQGAFYIVDELGEKLAKISNAMKRGGAAYLEGVIGSLMEIYSKADSFALITGDLKEDIRKQMQAEAARYQKMIDENEDKNGTAQERLDRVISAMQKIDQGIENPYLSIFGLTTPDKFEALLDYEMSVNGFMGRSLIFAERNDNPRRKPRAQFNREVPAKIAAQLRMMYSPGYSDTPDRVERIGNRVAIETDGSAAELLNMVYEEFWSQAEAHNDTTGLAPIPRRGYEMVAKISTVLAMREGLRTAEHVRWAYALVKRDIELKLRMAHANTAIDQGDALASRIMGALSSEHGETLGKIKNKCRAYKKDDVDRACQMLVDSGKIKVETAPAGNGKTTKRYFLC